MNRYDPYAEAQSKWTPPRELRHSAPREVRLSRCGIMLAVLSAALALCALVTAVWGGRASARQTEEARRLDTEGILTVARIVRLWKTGGEGKKYRVEYSFTAGGRVFHEQLKVPRQIWETMQESGTIPIRYLASDPRVSHPSAWNAKPLSVWLPILLPAVMIGMALLMAYSIRCQADLLASGRTVPAVVTDIRREHRAPAGRATVVHYQFRVSGAGVMKGKSENRKGAQRGVVFCALYDPDNPRRSALYPFLLVRVANS